MSKPIPQDPFAQWYSKRFGYPLECGHALEAREVWNAALNQPPKERHYTLRMGGSKVQDQLDALVATPEPARTDEKGGPMTYWGGLAEPAQPLSEDKAVEIMCVAANKQHVLEFKKLIHPNTYLTIMRAAYRALLAAQKRGE